MKKRVLSVILAVMMTFSLLAPASATTHDEIIDQQLLSLDDEGIVPFAEYMPPYGSVLALPYQAELTDLAASRGSYTKSCFVTSTGQMNLSCTFWHSGTSASHFRQLEIRLFRYTPWADDGGNIHYTGELIRTQTVTASAGTTNRNVTFNNLANGVQYFFLFRNISNTSAGSGYDISGIIDITG